VEGPGYSHDACADSVPSPDGAQSLGEGEVAGQLGFLELFSVAAEVVFGKAATRSFVMVPVRSPEAMGE
jgi:hypothetical protein